MSPSLNGDFNGIGPFRPPIDLPRWRDARPRPEHDRDEVQDVRRVFGPRSGCLPPMVGGYGDIGVERASWDLDPELEAGARRDLEVWGCNPFEED